MLRIAAAAVVVAAIASIILPLLWWRSVKEEQNLLFGDTYVYIDIAGIVGLLIAAAAATLILFVLARVLERLDALEKWSEGQRRSSE